MPIMPFEDCPICLDEMRPMDYEHPLQCDRRCGYNFCKNCIEGFISSSKDDYMEASDGNRHVKVFLLCPNCRSDLSVSIRDTLLLRKADGIKEAATEDELSASQCRLKKVMGQKEVQTAIWNARRLEAEYLGRELPLEEEEEKDENVEPPLEEYEEEGVEIDLVQGVHQSIHTKKQPEPKVTKPIHIIVDPTLFAGLDYFLSADEKDYVTQLMTSGETSQLVTAAQILYFCAQKSLDPQKAIAASSPSSALTPTNPKRTARTLSHRCSVFDLIDELQEARDKKDKKAKQTMEWTNQLYQHNNAIQARAAQQRKMNQELKKSAQIQMYFPIPVRMPKCFEIDLREVFELQFVDYEWDGTIKDAYSKITIGFTGRVERKTNYNEGVATVLGGLEDDVRIALPGQPRVLLSYVGQSAGKQGAMKGDVVTHIDGKDVSGALAAQMFIRINAAKQRGQRTLIMTLNAEKSVAEALKRRAHAIAEEWS